MAFDAILTEIVLDMNFYTEKVPFNIFYAVFQEIQPKAPKKPREVLDSGDQMLILPFWGHSHVDKTENDKTRVW